MQSGSKWYSLPSHLQIISTNPALQCPFPSRSQQAILNCQIWNDAESYKYFGHRSHQGWVYWQLSLKTHRGFGHGGSRHGGGPPKKNDSKNAFHGNEKNLKVATHLQLTSTSSAKKVIDLQINMVVGNDCFVRRQIKRKDLDISHLHFIISCCKIEPWYANRSRFNFWKVRFPILWLHCLRLTWRVVATWRMQVLGRPLGASWDPYQRTPSNSAIRSVTVPFFHIDNGNNLDNPIILTYTYSGLVHHVIL